MKRQAVTVRLRGGLGNQMFQYATGLSVAQKNDSDLVLDLSLYESQSPKDTQRSFALDAFAISQTQKISETVSPLRAFISKIRNKLFPVDPFFFDPQVFEADRLDGFFQNEKYFVDIRETLLKEFSLKTESAKFTETKSFIQNGTSVSLHVRRGDYVSNADAKAYHGVLGKEYYQEAYDRIVSKIGTDFTLFIFSDDVEWVTKNLNMHPQTYVLSGNDFSPAEEMILMSLCTHNIIANSSFSWWAAWLNQNPSKTVIAPEDWTADMRECDIIPDTWDTI